MGFINKYPYTDYSELNLDWVIEKMNKIEVDITEVVTDASAIATENAKEYVNTKMLEVSGNFDRLKSDVNAFKASVSNNLSEFDNQFESFKSDVNIRVDALESNIEQLRLYINLRIEEEKIARDNAINNMRNQILDEVGAGLVNLSVINYLTGARMTVQDMFNWLIEEFHLEGSLTINQIVALDNTLTQIQTLNKTCTQWVKGEIS